MENDVSPLRLAVTCLMEAAAKMSAAGEAMSVAGQAMSAAGETISAAAKAISIITKSATPRDIERETLDQSLDKGTMEGTSHEKASVTSEECTNPEDSDYYVLENETGIQNGAVGVRPEEACEKPGVSPREETSLPTGQPQVGEIHPTTIDRSGGDFKGPFSILVDREGDVLPIVCSIIREHKRVICYMPCAPSALDMYKDLIREPSGAMVLSITEASVDYLPYFFFECESFVLLVSEGIYLEELSKHGPIPCVIHVNWPSDVVRYQKQTSSVVAQVSVLVAFLEDRDIYPSGVEIMSRTIPWPSTEKLIKSLDTLRSTFQQELDTISPDAKEEMYFHWIACHGPHGSRYVKSWDAATLAHRANLYLLDVLQYKDEPSPDDDENELQVPLPRVPLEFIVENNLEHAVEDGVLYVAAAEAETTLSAWKDSRVKESAIPLNEASGHNGIKVIMPLDKTKNAESETRAASLADSYAQTSKPSHSEERFSIPTGHNFVGSNSEPAISNTPNEPILYYPPNPSVSQQHIILEQEFDVIPLIFYLATLRPKENTLCFVQDVKMMQTLQKMVEQMVSKPVYMLALGGPKGVKKAAGQACADSEGCLIFCSRLTTLLPETVRDQTFHSVVHAGWIGDGRRYYEQRNRNNLRRATLILTRQEYDELNLTIENLRREGYETSPSTAALNDLTYNGTFAKIRTRWKDQMSDSSNYRNLCRCFEAWISYHWIGIHRVVEWSAKDVATQANIFAKKFLLHGNAKGVPRNPVHPTVGRRLAVSPAFVLDFELEDAVQDKILVVEDLGD